MNRPWVQPQEVKDYTEFQEVKERDDKKLAVDIARAEHWVINYCNNRFDDETKYPTIPEPVKTAVILLAEAYAHNAVEVTKARLKSETFDDYSYTAAEGTLIDLLDLRPLLDAFVVTAPKGGVTMKLRKL